jgi:hypothetical protein
MHKDSIVTEVRRQRRAILESYNWDFEAMSRDVVKRQWTSGHKVVNCGKKNIRPNVAPNAYVLRGPA